MSEPADHSVRKSIGVAQAAPFDKTYSDNLPFPVLAELGGGDMHRARPQMSSPNVRDLASRLHKKVIRSDIQITPDGVVEFDSAIFRTRGANFITCNDAGISVYGRKQRVVERLARRLQSIVLQQEKKAGEAGYTLIKKSTFEIDKEFVPLMGAQPILDAELALLYGESFLHWHDSFKRRLRERPSGISILEGPPGCGKTSFLRGFMSANAETHRFYYVTAHDIHLLSEPEFVVLWSAERKKFADEKLVLVIEDAEQALMNRGNDNRTIVSTLLNYSDGLLSEFLKMHIICTINCVGADLDPALMRPGRLITHRIFNRLSAKEAHKLAEFKGIRLPRGQSDYSLAEIFNEPADAPEHRGRITGFAA